MRPLVQPIDSRFWVALARSFLYIVVMLATLVVGWFVIPASVHYHVTERYLFSSPQQDAVVYLAAILPKTGAYQTVENTQITWSGDREQAPSAALDVWKLWGEIKAGATQEATISYDVILNQGAARWVAPPMDFQLKPQADIESDDATLAQQAAQIAHGQTRADAYALYTFTSGYLSWPQGARIGVDQSALTAYTTRVGGCGEFANLAVALYRAAKIPAQAITGLALPATPPFWTATTTWNHPGGAHAWVEVYTDVGWELVDPSWGSAWPGPLKGIWFGRNDGSHLSYGESGQYARLYDELMIWGKQHGEMVGAMSNPLHFVAAATSKDVAFTPGATVQKGWDGRWVVTVALYLALVVSMRMLENRFKRPKPAQSNAA